MLTRYYYTGWNINYCNVCVDCDVYASTLKDLLLKVGKRNVENFIGSVSSIPWLARSETSKEKERAHSK